MKTKLVLSMALLAAFLICLPVVEAMRPGYYFYYAQQQRWKTNPYTHSAGTYTPYWQQNVQPSSKNWWQNVQPGEMPMYTLHKEMFNPNSKEGTLSGQPIGQSVIEQNADMRTLGAQTTNSFDNWKVMSARFTPYVFKGMKDMGTPTTTGMTAEIMKMHGMMPSSTGQAMETSTTTAQSNPYTGATYTPAGTMTPSSGSSDTTPGYMK